VAFPPSEIADGAGGEGLVQLLFPVPLAKALVAGVRSGYPAILTRKTQ